ncbi:ImmA/IrrE family metallo-endopeptidase [Corynebacterium striatum]|uniref:ImmA/IrrE family metallo-endopeptidase n=1 Tax=Corynebacterium striatum TaxID=43770 RepID=UPI0027BA804F|nr:ImmA/IrrE family metallo-endopeptidase [Corynebacterium striatum]
MTISAVELHLLAESMGVQLLRHTSGPPGWYDHNRRIISTRRGQSIGQYKSVLAHELGHAHYGDTPTGNGHYDQRQERRADEYAARLLIDPHDFETAAAWHHGHLPAIADELEVTKHILKTWQSLHERQAA